MDVDEAELEHPPAAQRPADAPLPDTQPGDAADEPAYKRVRLDWSPATAAGGDGPADAAAASGAVKSEGDGAAGAAAAGCGPAAAAGVGIASSAGEATDPPAVKPEPSADAGAELGADAAAATPPPADDADKPRAKHAEVKPTMGAYTLREEYLIKQEAEGEIAFKYVENDGSDQNMIYLTGLKNIFSKQLPNMPKEYICRLVFDRRHRSTALVKRNGAVIGGITYRAFHAQAFGEIAFCAVTSSEQVKGFGTRLMNHAKEHARTRDRLTHFLTYADNNAVGYFAKQGFTKEVTMDAERWKGFIKDYDGGTLMECIMNPKFCFTGFPDMIRAQRAALDAKIRTISNAHIIHAGLSHFKVRPCAAPRLPPRRALLLGPRTLRLWLLPLPSRSTGHVAWQSPQRQLEAQQIERSCSNLLSSSVCTFTAPSHTDAELLPLQPEVACCCMLMQRLPMSSSKLTPVSVDNAHTHDCMQTAPVFELSPSYPTLPARARHPLHCLCTSASRAHAAAWLRPWNAAHARNSVCLHLCWCFTVPVQCSPRPCRCPLAGHRIRQDARAAANC
mmetsp:Transcript_12959/g.37611  ORF Transcript_12959/g.37611 Transcript_12959/m.37611 type:complete len:561 (-) Transcript_12959:1058-2740(-)